MLQFSILKSHPRFNLLKFINIEENMFRRRLHIYNMRKIHNNGKTIQVTFNFTHKQGLDKILIPQTLIANLVKKVHGLWPNPRQIEEGWQQSNLIPRKVRPFFGLCFKMTLDFSV